jgi:putative drug exporter of the RND superfamily
MGRERRLPGPRRSHARSDSGRAAPPGRRRAAIVLAAVLAACTALGLAGLDVEHRLQPTSLIVEGTDSARGQELAEDYFGHSSPFAVLLRGPAAEIERQGPRVVRVLRRDADVTVVSPWDRGTVGYLRPGPRRAIVLLDYHVPLGEAMRDTVPALERRLDAEVEPPLEVLQSGYATVSRALQEESLGATERAELIAAPLLLIVLLLVFRSVLAAAIPLLLGALTVFAGRGVLVLLDGLMTIEALSVVVCTMMGLALGVDYSLFIVSRFREELAKGVAPGEAARTARRTAGRTTVIAGSTLFVSIFLSAFLQPGTLLLSLATALVVVTPISVALAALALPALLGLLGERIELGRIGGRAGAAPVGASSWVAGMAAAVLRRPALATAAIAIPLILLTLPALAFNTGAPGIDELPASSPARQDAEEIGRAVGPGWEAPFQIVLAARRGPVTTPERLRLLARAQRRIAAQPGVRAVIGPAPIQRATRPLRGLGERLASPGADGLAQLGRLGPNLRRAGRAVEQLRGGLAAAAAGSGLLAEGSRRAEDGAGLLAGGLEHAADAGERATAGIDRLRDGSERIAAGQRRLSAGTLSLTLGLRSLVPRIRSRQLARARSLARRLERAAASDPSLRSAAEEARTLARAVASGRDEVRRLRETAVGVNGGVNRLVPGGERLQEGVHRLGEAASGLSSGLGRLAAGAERLAGGLTALQGGASALQQGLAAGYHRSYPLQRGLTRAGVRVSVASAPLLRGARALRRESPGLFDSGYFVLSAVDGARPVPRALAAEAVNVERGGQAARLLVVSTEPFNTAGSRATGERLLASAERLGREGDMEAGLSGGAAVLNDYADATLGRLPIVIGAIVLITFLMLVAILRAPLLAALAVGLNLLSVGAAVGVLSLICKLPADWPLGGHPYIDTVGAAGIFGVTFGLSIDYAVFLLARMRERYELDGDNAAAIRHGLEKTAAVITGAAAIMAAVFVSFAAAPIATVSQLGVGLTVAILLDATVVRIVLLPALMLLLGDRVWRVPPALDRILPGRRMLTSPGTPRAAAPASQGGGE